MTSTTLYTLRPVVRISERGAVHIEDGREGPGGMFTYTLCGDGRLSQHMRHATGEATCKRCLARATCARGHAVCGTPELCARLVASPTAVPATELRDYDEVYVTGRWTTIHAVTVRPSGAVRFRTADGGTVTTRVGASFAALR